MKKFFRALAFIFFIPLFYTFVAETFLFIFAHFAGMWANGFIYGVIVYVALYAMLLWSKITFLEVLEHELIHTVVAYLFFRKVLHLEADWRRGGYVEFIGRLNTVILLAPYCLPLFTLPLLAIKPFMASSTHPFLDFFMGLTWAFHVVALLIEFSPRQTDIARIGLKSAFLIVFVVNCIFAVITLGFALNQYAHVGAYFKEAFLRGWKIYVWAYAKAFSATL